MTHIAMLEVDDKGDPATWGVAPARAYIPELLDDVLQGRINPGRVLTSRPTSMASPTRTPQLSVVP